jgi:hypothetical protein
MYTPGFVHSLVDSVVFRVVFPLNVRIGCFLISKGLARSSLPYRRTPPSWCRTESDTVKQEIIKFAKKGLTPSQIGVRLRDSMGIPQVVTVTGSKILRILKVAGMLLVPSHCAFSTLPPLMTESALGGGRIAINRAVS